MTAAAARAARVRQRSTRSATQRWARAWLRAYQTAWVGTAATTAVAASAARAQAGRRASRLGAAFRTRGPATRPTTARPIPATASVGPPTPTAPIRRATSRAASRRRYAIFRATAPPRCPPGGPARRCRTRRSTGATASAAYSIPTAPSRTCRSSAAHGVRPAPPRAPAPRVCPTARESPAGTTAAAAPAARARASQTPPATRGSAWTRACPARSPAW